MRVAGSFPMGGGIRWEAASRLLDHARFRADGVLLETEGMRLLDALGIATPRVVEFRDAAAAHAAFADPPFQGERAVLKVVAPDILHKTEVGGVRIIQNRRDVIVAEVEAMARRLDGHRVTGYMLCEYVAHDDAFGHEFLLGLRWTRDFGPVVTLGVGGVHAEFMARAFRPGEGLAAFSTALGDPRALRRALDRLVPARLVTEGRRGRPPELPPEALVDVVQRFLAFGAEFCPYPIAELEVNPLVVANGQLFALDALATLTRSCDLAPPARPLHKLRHLLEPRTIAIVGVSEKGMNPGRVILRNVLAEGFDPACVTVVKRGLDSIDGCRCVPSLDETGAHVDLAVLSVSAEQSAAMLAEIAERRLAESVVLIPGGLEEKPGSEGLVTRMRQALHRSRETAWGGPVVNGGNCLGIRSVPGRYNTLFIPEYKMPVARGVASPVALVTGSGAFAVSKTNKLAGVNPLHTITIGNQMDLTLADYLEYLKDDTRIEVFAVYVEGFRPQDGGRFVRVAEQIVQSGRTVVLMRAGRTGAGAEAAASHTAAVAGDERVGRLLAEAAGVVVADALDDFEDLVRLFTFLRDREVTGLKLGAVSNAGFECVAIADSLDRFELADFTDATRARLRATLEQARLESIVSVRNPMDLTPILGDEGYEQVVRAVLADPGVDAALVGIVPMTQALNSLAPGPGHGDDVARADSIASRLLKLKDETRKPFVVVVDAGRLYDPMAQRLEDGGLPVFRTADRAMRLFGRWCVHQLERAHRPDTVVIQA